MLFLSKINDKINKFGEIEMLKIYVRADLKMRKGKMAAQSAHAAMKLLIEVMTKSKNKLILNNKEVKKFENFLNNPFIEIVMVNSEEELNLILDKSKPFSIIVDSGRTEFHGVKTVTCGAQGIFEEVDLVEMDVPHIYGRDIVAKQVFIYNKDHSLSKEHSCRLSVLSCLLNMYNKLKASEYGLEFNLEEDTEFNAWILNAFGKICLSTETLQELNLIEEKLIESNIKFNKVNLGNNYCICVEPKTPSIIDNITGNLKLI